MLHLLALAAVLPSAVDVQRIEEARILEPLTDISRDGRRTVEFAPTVETRNVDCAPVGRPVYRCSYESRVKEALENTFGPWTVQIEHLVWRQKRWQRADKVR